MSRSKQKKSKVGFTAGSFDLCHVGHIRMFEECKKVCDYLIVAVQEDPSIDRPMKNKPIQSIEERVEIIKAIRHVDKVLIYKTEADLLKLLKRIKIDIRILGADWEGKPFTGHELKMPVYFNSRNHNYSSTELRERIYKAELKSSKTECLRSL